MRYKTFDKFSDPRGDMVCCETHDETWHDCGQPCPVCLAEGEEKDVRDAKAAKLYAHRRRIHMAKIYRDHLADKILYLTPAESVQVAFASTKFMEEEIKFLEENRRTNGKAK